MGLNAKIIDSSTNNGEPSAKVELYKNDNANARIFNPPGVDARPLDGDSCFTENSEDTEGGKDILGFIDPKNEPVAEKGEHRIYARDADGNIVATMHLKKNGIAELNGNVDFAVRYLELETAFNQLKGDHDALVTAVENQATFYSTHNHQGVNGPTGTPLPLPLPVYGESASTADITPAKVDNVKLP